MSLSTHSVAAFVAVLLASCTSHNPINCSDGVCSDTAIPYCDVDGIEGQPNRCIAVSCSPGAFVTCRADDAVHCGPQGDAYERVPCVHGCSGESGCHACTPNESSCVDTRVEVCGASGTIDGTESCVAGCSSDTSAHCVHIVPRYVPNACDQDASAPSFNVTASASFDTSLDANCTGGVVQQAGAPELCVVRFGTISIASAARLKVAGTRALAMIADHDLTVAGVVDASADGQMNGAGAALTKSGGSANGTMAIGGGGAGFRHDGGAGGSATADGGGRPGGTSLPDPAALAVFVGGRQSGDTVGSFPGGGGGGAITLVSCRGRVTISGAVNAGGGGALGGGLVLGMPQPGGGGGAGGYIVLQGLDIEISGGLFANGGGGGAGAKSDGTQGLPGEDGSEIPGRVTYGGATDLSSGPGGCGGGEFMPCSGGRPSAGTARAGGGGGAAGFIQFYLPAGRLPTGTATSVSPPARPLATLLTR